MEPLTFTVEGKNYPIEFTVSGKETRNSHPIAESDLPQWIKKRFSDFLYVPFTEGERKYRRGLCDPDDYIRLQIEYNFCAWIYKTEASFIRPGNLYNKNDTSRMKLARRFYYAHGNEGRRIPKKYRAAYLEKAPQPEYDAVKKEWRKAFSDYNEKQEKKWKKKTNWGYILNKMFWGPNSTEFSLTDTVIRIARIYFLCCCAFALLNFLAPSLMDRIVKISKKIN